MPAAAARSMTPDRRRALLEAAAEEFAQAGYEDASLNRILRRGGFSKSSFYYYVESKAQLFTWVVTDLGAELARAAEVPEPASLGKADFWESVERLALRLAELAGRDERNAVVGRLFYLPGVPRDDGAGLARAEAVIEAWLRAALTAGRASGAVRADLPAPLQDALTLAVLRAFDEWTLAHSELAPTDVEVLVRAQVATLRRMLAP